VDEWISVLTELHAKRLHGYINHCLPEKMTRESLSRWSVLRGQRVKEYQALSHWLPVIKNKRKTLQV
jgi:hypothetical protein